MAVFVTLEEAKQQLRITDSLHDADVQAKLDQAEGIVLEYLDVHADPAWTPATVPKSVTTAIERYLSHLYEDRTGRASDGEKPAAADVWADLRLILGRRRTPVFGVAIDDDEEAAP